MSTRLIRRLTGGLAAALMAMAAVFGLSSTAMADGSGPNLVLEPYVACIWNSPFTGNVKELGWKVFQGGPQGTPGQNDWRCDYKVSVTVPTGLDEGEHGNVGADDMNFTIPGLYNVTIPVNWQQMCQDQYGPTANIVWVGGTNGSIGSPWACIGTPGHTYKPYDINTPPARLQGVVNNVLS